VYRDKQEKKEKEREERERAQVSGCWLNVVTAVVLVLCIAW
jgi:succinate dehydrogenase hydrophobic anchor subunit